MGKEARTGSFLASLSFLPRFGRRKEETTKLPDSGGKTEKTVFWCRRDGSLIKVDKRPESGTYVVDVASCHIIPAMDTVNFPGKDDLHALTYRSIPSGNPDDRKVFQRNVFIPVGHENKATLRKQVSDMLDRKNPKRALVKKVPLVATVGKQRQRLLK